MITRLLSRPHRAVAPLDPAASPTHPAPPTQPAPMPNGQLTKQLQGSIQQFLRQERVITMATYTLIPVILLTLTIVFGLGYLRTTTHAARSATATTTAVGLSGTTAATPAASATLVPVAGATTPTAMASPTASVTSTVAPKKTPTVAPTMTPTPVATIAPQVVLAIDSGGSGSGIYQADTDLSGGSSTSATTTHPIDTSLAGNSAPAIVYQTAREGASFTYTIGQLTPGAHYTVLLDFAEIGVTAAGQRQFNVAINDQPALTNFDIVAQSGAEYKAIAQSFVTTATAGGQITITFTQGKANVALVSGIEVVTASAGS